MDQAQTRQEFICAAVSFLQNPKLLDNPLSDKLKFLKDKGLTELEVDEALNLALINRQRSSDGRWNFLLILGFCFGGYKVYQAYLESKKSHLARQKQLDDDKKKEALDNKQAEEERIKQEKDLPNLVEIQQKLIELKKLLEFHRTSFSSDIQSLKTLLLSHEKFAAPPVIPAWQLKDDSTNNDEEQNLDTKITADIDDKKRKGKKNKSTSSADSAFIETPIAPNP